MTLASRLKKRLYFIVAAYFRFFANFAFRRWQPTVIAVTGSVGKTTMLHLLEQQLESKAHYSHNASKLRWIFLVVAVPIRSLYFSHREKFYVVEIDGERPHEAEFLASWLRPEITLWISLGRSHAIQFEHQVKDGTFENIDKAITHEFAMLPQYTKKRIYIDEDVPLMLRAVQKIKQNYNIKAEIIKCSKDALKSYSVYPDHTTIEINETIFNFSEPMPQDISIQLAMLIDLCKYLKIELKTDLFNLAMPPGRNSFFKGKNGLKLIDSSYNAHLISVKSVLSMMKSMQADHKWIVLGDIVDQGTIEAEEHLKLADLIASIHPEQVILVGRRTKRYTAPRLKELGIDPFTTNDPHRALKYIQKHTIGRETIVFKGSQYLEWIIEKLLQNPEDAAKLPRREKAAIKRRLKKGLDS